MAVHDDVLVSGCDAYRDFPIAQMFRLKDTPFQNGFAAQARKRISDDDEFVLASSRRGLAVLGRNEAALEQPCAVLRELYGERLEAQRPAVRLLEGPVLRQPVMHLRISAEARHREAIRRAMARRGAPQVEEYLRPHYCVLRYEAPLTDLLGLPAELSALTDGKARHWAVLSHYAPLPPHGGRAA